ncbi:MAG: glycosyltransferase family 2 protein, partial [Candidatus Hydrogenedentes bacterium]|nr:glycosyltransferase family 2 protein [Candidatus Hydrogenedentota bacterium]
AYCEEDCIEEFHGRLTAVMTALGRSFEIVYVNDGSTDATFSRLRAIYDRDRNVSALVDLYTNFGRPSAMTAGLTYARGTKFLFIDCDLQLDPEDIPRLIAEHDKGFDIVSGYRLKRRDPVLRRFFSCLANIVMRRVARHNMRDMGCAFKVFDGRLVRSFDYGPFRSWNPIYVYARARYCSEVPVSHHPRRSGGSRWSVGSLFGFYMDHLVGLAHNPFRFFCLMLGIPTAGALMLVLLSPGLRDLVARLATPGMAVIGYLSLVLLVLLLMAVLGEFVMRNYMVLQRYPCYVIRSVLQRPRTE